VGTRDARSDAEKMFAAIAGGAPFMVWMGSTDAELTYVNAPWLEFAGRSSHQELGGGWRERVHPKDVGPLLETYRSAARASQPFKTEFRLLRSDGEYRHVQLAGTPRPANGKPDGYIGSAMDITLRNRGQQALREGEERYKQLAESIVDLFFAVDNDFRCTYWNAPLEELTGIPATEALGSPIHELLPLQGPSMDRLLEGVRSSAHPESAELELTLGERPIPFGVFAYPSRDGVSVILKDLTQRKEAEAALRSSEVKYRTVFEFANDAVLIFEAESEIIWEANRKACEVYGFSRDELVGMSLKSLTKDVPRGEKQIRTTLREKTYCDFQTVHFRKDGTEIDFTVNASIIDYGGKKAVLSINRDASRQKQAEEYFNRALAWQQGLFEGSRDAAFVTDESGLILISNRSASLLTGHGKDELLGMDLWVVSHEEHRDLVRKNHALAFRGKEVAWESPLRRKDGGRIDGEWQCRSVEVGDLRYVQTIVRDASERKQKEHRLQVSGERYRAFVEQSSDGIWRFEAEMPIPVDLPEDEQIDRIFDFGYVGEANNTLARMWGFKRARDIVGRRIGEFIPRTDNQYIEYLKQFIRSGYRILDVETHIADRRGRVHYFQNTFFGTLENGCLVRAWGSQKEVTERLEAERKLRLLAQTIASAKDCVMLTDLEDTILYVNDAFMTTYGYAEEEILGKNIDMLRGPDVPREVKEEILPSTLSGGWYGEIINRRKDGSVFPVELWTSMVRNDDGEPVALVGVARDVTERRKAEEQIRASLREKEVLLKEIHHRVKNNLQVVSSLLNLQSQHIKDEEMLRVFKESQNRVRSMALIHEKLYGSSNLAEISFGDYVRDLATQLFRSYSLNAAGVSLEVDANNVLLGIDRAIPCGIIVNELVSNSLKYGFPDRRVGTIYIRLHAASDETVRLVVGDTGVGLPEDLDIEKSDSLGLKLVKMLTGQLSGELKLVRNGSRSGDTGAEFVITF
ncbi:MAG: PAS domain S-box protein, partial [Bacteroidota bacterium]